MNKEQKHNHQERRNGRPGAILEPENCCIKTGTDGKRAATLGPKPSEYDKRTQEQARKYEQDRKTAADREVEEGKFPPPGSVTGREGIDPPAGVRSPTSSPISERSERGKAA